MPKSLKNLLLFAGLLYLISLPVSIVLGGALFARPLREPFSWTEFVKDVPQDWDRSFLNSAKEVEIPIGARAKLRGTIIGGDSTTTVIVLHEARSNRAAALEVGYSLWRAGFGVLLLDRRAHGASDGEILALFAGEADDVSAVIDRLVEEQWSGTSRIAVYGIGDGGTSALIAASRDQRIDAVIAERPARTAEEFVASTFSSFCKLPASLLIVQAKLAVLGMKFLSDEPLSAFDARDALVALNTPCLILESRLRSSEADDVFQLIPASRRDIRRGSPEALRAQSIEFLKLRL